MDGRVIAAVGVALALLAGGACSSSSPPTPIGTVADAGFRPPDHGFQFENYGDTLPDGAAPTNLTADDMRTMFGDIVCADANSGKCDLIPEALAWLVAANQGMSGGHCFGFSVLAELLWQQKLRVTTLGAPATNDLNIDNNQTLQRLIAYDWALQLLDSVQSQRITGSPNTILAKLQKALRPNPTETYTIAIWKRDSTGGHAVTPYAVYNKGGGKFDVLIYDNNWPDQSRAISFDTKADTWTYDAAANPNQPNESYQGDAKSQTLVLFPTSPGLGTQPCPFCGKVPTSGSKTGSAEKHATEEIYLLGSDTEHANLIVTDHAGQRLGYVNGKLVNQIPGAHVDDPISNDDWTDKLEPDFFVPANGTYTITLDGTALNSADTETVGMIGPSFDLSVDNIPVNPGDKDVLVAEPDATKLSYTSSRSEQPTISLAVSDAGADYSFTVDGVSDQPGSTINLALPAEGDSLSMDNVGSAGVSSMSLKMTRSTQAGTQDFRHDAISLVGADTAVLQFGNWSSPSQGMPLVTTHNGQQSTQTLIDQAG